MYCALVHRSEDTTSAEQAIKKQSTSAKASCAEVKAGCSFDELALIYLVPRAARIKAKEISVVRVLDRGSFRVF